MRDKKLIVKLIDGTEPQAPKRQLPKKNSAGWEVVLHDASDQTRDVTDFNVMLSSVTDDFLNTADNSVV